MHFRKHNTTGGFVEYLAAVVVIILILVGLRVDIRRYAEEYDIPNLALDSKIFVQTRMIEPTQHIWREKIKPFLLGERFGSLREKVQEHTTISE